MKIVPRAFLLAGLMALPILVQAGERVGGERDGSANRHRAPAPWDDGIIVRQSGNTTVWSDGRSARDYGGLVIYNDGTAGTRTGNLTIFGNGRACMQMGNATFCDRE